MSRLVRYPRWRMSCSPVLRAAACLLVLQLAPSARAGGAVEEVAQVALHPTDPGSMVLRYRNFGDGLVYTDDGGATWRLLCGSAVDATEFRSGGKLVLTGGGVVLMGTSDGLWEGDDGGCRWRRAPEVEGIWISDVAVHPSEPEVAFAVTARTQAGSENGIVRRAPDGTWSELGSSDDVLPIRLRVAALPGGGMRLYQDALRGVGAPLQSPVIRVSDDAGESWEEFPVPPFDGGVAVRLEAVDPSDPDRIVASLERREGDDAVLVSVDRGATFTEYVAVHRFGGLAFAPDGRIWIGDEGSATGDASEPGGVWHAAGLDVPPERLTEAPVRCLAHGADGRLHACEAWSFGTVNTDTGELQRTFEMSTAAELLSCDGMNMAELCQTQLCRGFCGPAHFPQAPLCCAYDDPFCGPRLLPPEQVRCEGAAVEPDAGAEASAPPAGDAGAHPPQGDGVGGEGGGCACAAPGRNRGAALPLALAGALLAGALGRRRR